MGSTGRDRFSKAAVLAYIEKSTADFERDYGFTRSNGWSQVAGRGESVNRAYGEYDALATLAEQIEWGHVVLGATVKS